MPTSFLPPNFFATVPPGVLSEIMSRPKGQPRVRALFELQPRRAIPREAIETVAQQRDPLRRVRADKGPRMGSVIVLSSRTRAIYRQARLEPLPADCFVGVPISEVEALGEP